MAALTLDYAKCCELAGEITYAVDHDDKATLLEVLEQLRVTSTEGCMDAIQHSGLGNELLKLVNHKDKEIEQAASNLLADGSWHKAVVTRKKRKTTASAAASSSNDVPTLPEVFLSFTFPLDRSIERTVRICWRQSLGDNAGVVDREYAHVDQSAPEAVVLRQVTFPGDRWAALEASSGRLLVEYVATAEPEQAVVIQRTSLSVGGLKEELAAEKHLRGIHERQMKTLKAEKELLRAKLISPLPQLSRYSRTGKVALGPGSQRYQMIEADFHQSVQRHRRGPVFRQG